jgi:hypothetical protein
MERFINSNRSKPEFSHKTTIQDDESDESNEFKA